MNEWIPTVIQVIVYAVSIGIVYGTISTRLKYMESKLDKHNNFIERLYRMEYEQGKQEVRICQLEKERDE